MEEFDIKDISDKAWLSGLKKDYRSAYSLAKRAAQRGDTRGIYLCALILEKGWLNDHKDLSGAYEYYRELAVDHDSPEGYLGCVRIMINREQYNHREKALELCEISKIDVFTRVAYVLEGRIYEELYTPPNYKTAKKKYLKSALNGSVWGLHKYARALWKSGNKPGSVAVHVLSVLTRPVYLLIWGRSCMRKD